MDTPFTTDALAAHTDFMRRLSVSLLGHEQDAEDLTQSVQLGVLAAGHGGSVANRNWLSRVVRRRSANALRNRATRKHMERNAARREAIPDPALVLERLELQQKVLAAVVVLNETYRQVIDLRYTEGLSPTEIAQRLGVPVSTVKTRLQRAIERLRESLDRSCDGDRDTWCVLLAPLTGGRWVPGGGSQLTTPTAVGALVMSTKMLFVATAVVLGLGAYVAWLRPEQIEQELAQAKAPVEMAAGSVPASATLVDAPNRTERSAVESTPNRTPLAAAEVETSEGCDWSVSGTLRDAQGAAVAGGELLVLFTSPFRWESELVTVRCDSDGRYRLRMNAPSQKLSARTQEPFKLSVHATAPGHRPTLSQLLLPELNPGSATPVEFDPRIDAGACIRGRVLDSAGSPVAGASLTIGVDDNRSLGAGQTDASGSYVIALPDEGKSMRLVAWHAKHGLASSESWASVRRDVDLPDLQLRSAASLQGQLTFPDGVPITDLQIRFAPLENRQPFSLSRFALRNHNADGLNMGTVNTDAEGNFSIEGISPGTYTLTMGETILLSEERLEIGEATTGEFFEAELALHWLRVVVVDDAGLPLPGADANMMLGLGGVDGRVDGPNAAIEDWVVPGEWSLSAGFPGARNAQQTRLIGEFDYRNEVRLVLDFNVAMGRIQVLAQREGGERLNSCTLRLSSIAAAGSKSVSQNVELDADGISAEIPAGAYHYTIYSNDAWRELAFETDVEGTIDVLEGETVSLRATLTQAGRLALTCNVSDGGAPYISLDMAEVATGEPLRRTTLSQQLESGATQFGGMQAGEEGVSGLLAPGLWNFRVHAIGYEDHQATVLIRAGRATALSVVLNKL